MGRLQGFMACARSWLDNGKIGGGDGVGGIFPRELGRGMDLAIGVYFVRFGLLEANERAGGE